MKFGRNFEHKVDASLLCIYMLKYFYCILTSTSGTPIHMVVMGLGPNVSFTI
jgi:hypothetical protein